MQMLALKEIHMTYGKGDGVVHALRGVDMEVERGELLAVTGKSGCGKSTLLNILGGVCKPTGGSYFFEGKEVSQFFCPSARGLPDSKDRLRGAALCADSGYDSFSEYRASAALPRLFQKKDRRARL